MTEKPETKKVAGLGVRVGYPDGHAEIDYKASMFVPTVTFQVTAAEVLELFGIFEKAREFAEKAREKKDA